MKKKILSLLFALCLGLLPTGALAADVDETLTAGEAESKYGISLSTDYINFDSYYQWEKVEPITVTLTNNGIHTVNYEY